MTLVDVATTSASAGPERSLQDWALAQTSMVEHLAAIELVLAHDFDEPYLEPLGAVEDDARRLRADFLIDAAGIARERRATTAGVRHGTEADLRLPAAA